MDHVVFDVEIARTVEEAGGWDRTDRMGLGVAALWDYGARRVRLYGPDDVPQLQDRLLRADRISCFNGRTFDLPVVFGVSRQDAPAHSLLRQLAPRVDDLLERIWQALGRREKGWRVDDIAPATLNCRKSGKGEDAPLLFQRGQWAKLCDYVCCDVMIERDLTDFADAYGYLCNFASRVDLPAWKPGPAVEAMDTGACL